MATKFRLFLDDLSAGEMAEIFYDVNATGSRYKKYKIWYNVQTTYFKEKKWCERKYLCKEALSEYNP